MPGSNETGGVTSAANIRVGDLVECRTAAGDYLWMRVVGPWSSGHKFPYFPVARDGYDESIPWPVDAIRAVRMAGAKP